MISFLILEKEKNLKHMQLICGMNLGAYWISNLLFDIAKAMVTMLITIALIYAYNLGVSLYE